MKDVGLRSPCEKVGGLVYFGRMVDQIRAHARGELPAQYQATLGKGLDEYCVNFLGVSYNLIVQYVNEGLSDAAILQSCFGMGHRASEAEIYMWNEFMLKRGWHDDASPTLKQLKREEGLTARSEIETIFQLIDVAEGRAPHTNHYDGSFPANYHKKHRARTAYAVACERPVCTHDRSFPVHYKKHKARTAYAVVCERPLCT